MSKRKFMVIDLFIFMIPAVVIEVAGLYVKINVLDNPTSFWYVSLNTVFILIAMFRWDIKGALIVIPLTGATLIAYEAFRGIDAYYYLIYLVGTSFIFLNLLWFKIYDKKKMGKSLWHIIFYSLTGYTLIILGRSLISLALGYNFTSTISMFIVGDAFSVIIGLVIMTIVYFQKTILVDIDTYLHEVREEISLNGQ